MTSEQGLILAVLAGTVALFLWGRWRHDVVALAALILCAAFGLVEHRQAFSGFGHPAVITVVAVLVLGAGLQAAGTIDVLMKRLLPRVSSPGLSTIVLMSAAAILSAFMNNVGALALLMPVALQIAERSGVPPGKVLMPLAFCSILGGMTTLIGTPPNLIVSGFRQESIGEPFAMFDYSPVGVAVAVAGVLFIAVVGRILVPERKRSSVAGFETGPYLTEARVPEESAAVGMSLGEVETALSDADAVVVDLVRGEKHVLAPSRYREIHAGDILLLRAEPEGLADAISKLDLALVDHSKDEDGDQAESHPLTSGDVTLVEIVVLPNSVLAGRSVESIALRSRYGLNLLAVSREGQSPRGRLRNVTIRTGDVLLVQGASDAVNDFCARYRCAPLAARTLPWAQPNRAMTAAAVLAVAIAVTVFGWATPAVAFGGGVLLFLLLGVVSPREVYDFVDWPVVVLLGALIPVAGAMESTGAADLLARVLLDSVAQGQPVVALVVMLVLSMTLSDFMNNAATAAVMCPIAIGAAERLGTSADPFLMAVAVGASCAFLTPIGHQNNTLILGPGGFHFGDYWRLGLPLEVIVVLVGVPTILWVWPL
ncbi:MAG: SLC13 family permease [Gammaproteobacteria bacterium]|nr:SLC13 family permease [Gammaproteobacteria bacterium]